VHTVSDIESPLEESERFIVLRATAHFIEQFVDSRAPSLSDITTSTAELEFEAATVVNDLLSTPYYMIHTKLAKTFDTERGQPKEITR
jgi:hypothetical protein